MSPTTVIFDIDGTLVDTNYLHAIAWRRAFVECGLDVPTARIHRMVGAASEVLLEHLAPDANDEVREQIKDAWSRFFDELKPEIRPLPRAQALLREVARRGITVVLASSSQPDDLEALLTALDAGDAIHDVVAAGDVDQAKPDPGVFHVALEKAGAGPGDAIVVGDSPWDVEAAARAGLRTVGVLTGGFSRAELEAAGAVAVYDDPGAILAALDSPPLADEEHDAGEPADAKGV